MKNHTKQKNREQVVAQAVCFVELVDHQKDSVVSRMVLNNKSGTITLFTF